MEKEKAKQIQYLTKITGGPHHYEGKDMKEAHSKVKIDQGQFDASWELLSKSMTELNVNGDHIGQIKDLFYSVKKDVVNKE